MEKEDVVERCDLRSLQVVGLNNAHGNGLVDVGGWRAGSDSLYPEQKWVWCSRKKSLAFQTRGRSLNLYKNPRPPSFPYK